MRPPLRWFFFFIWGEFYMNIYVYSDESRVFDKEHNDYFVFAGLICIGTNEKEIWSRKYSAVEKLLGKVKV